MTTAIAVKEDNSKLYESLAMRGDLSALSPADKAKYYSSLCDRLGLDPATQPFVPLKLNGKEILYASKGATDQLARLHNVNRAIIEEKEMRGVYIVTVEASLPNGRREQSKGAVTIDNLKGDAFCNAIMKAETKAKRRATLSILGLGMLDESEMETIPAYTQQARKTADRAEYETINEEKEPVDDLRIQYETQVAALCSDLNKAGDSIVWSQPTLKEHTNGMFEVSDGLQSLTFDTFEILIGDLQGRLKGLE